MLLSVCLNPAVDLTYRLTTSLIVGDSHRVASVSERAGGKGINVARVLHQLGARTTVLAPIGGANGRSVRTALAATGIGATLVELEGETRRTVTAVDERSATVLNEPGPTVSRSELSELIEAYRSLLDDTGPDQVELVILSGSLPPGPTPDTYRTFTEIAEKQGLPVIVDAEGPALQLCLEARPYLVKPNLAELARTLGAPVRDRAEIVASGHRLLGLGARNAVISCGKDGLIAVTEDRTWAAVGQEQIAGNPTGAGDALVAALALGAVRGEPWPEVLRTGVALSAAAVAAPLAGEVDPTEAARLHLGVVVEELEDGHVSGPRS
jgi:1-phosphofructokinase family hexose kinase